MNREDLENEINNGSSVTMMSKTFNKSPTTIRYWLKKFDLKTNFMKGDRKWKHTNEEIKNAWTKSTSLNSFFNNLGVTNTGGAFYHYKKRLNELGLSLDFGTGVQNRQSYGGKVAGENSNKDAIKSKRRIRRSVLKKALDLDCRPYECEECGISKWNDKILKLHIHHKDKNRENNEVDNLQYLCPNCHNIEHYGDVAQLAEQSVETQW